MDSALTTLPPSRTESLNDRNELVVWDQWRRDSQGRLPGAMGKVIGADTQWDDQRAGFRIKPPYRYVRRRLTCCKVNVT